MKKLIVIALLIGPLTTMSVEKSTKAYICNDKYNTEYHANEKCPRLVDCATDVKQVAIDEVKEFRTACKTCFKKRKR